MDMTEVCGGGGGDENKVPTLEDAICNFLIYLKQEIPKLEGRNKMTSADVIIFYPILFDQFVRREIGGKVAEDLLHEFEESGLNDELEKDILNIFEERIDDDTSPKPTTTCDLCAGPYDGEFITKPTREQFSCEICSTKIMPLCDGCEECVGTVRRFKNCVKARYFCDSCDEKMPESLKEKPFCGLCIACDFGKVSP